MCPSVIKTEGQVLREIGAKCVIRARGSVPDPDVGWGMRRRREVGEGRRRWLGKDVRMKTAPALGVRESPAKVRRETSHSRGRTT